MNEFIMLTDAITGKKLLLRTSLIMKIEESTAELEGTTTSVSEITFLDNKLSKEFVSESLKYIMNRINKINLNS